MYYGRKFHISGYYGALWEGLVGATGAGGSDRSSQELCFLREGPEGLRNSLTKP